MSIDPDCTDPSLPPLTAEQDNLVRRGAGSEIEPIPAAPDAVQDQARLVRSMRQLTAGVGHDLNDLLTVVMANLEMLKERTRPDDERLKFIEDAFEGTQRAALLARQMLDAHVETADALAQANSLESVIRSVGALLAKSVDAEVRTETALAPGTIAYCDVKQLELAILNLAMNAHEAMPGGGVLAIEASDVTVAEGEFPELDAGSYVRIAVVDNGKGMDAATLARAAEPHFTTKAAGSGAGLGLSVVDGIVSRARGLLRLQSRPGSGTTAEMWLPGGPCRRSTDRPDSGPVRRLKRNLLVLLVDDDPLVRSSIRGMVEGLGHVVVEAGSGREALAVLGVLPACDVMITDYAMHGIKGTELAAAVVARRPSVKVVLCSGYSAAFEADPYTHARLRKPFDMDVLRTTLESLAIEDTSPAANANVLSFPRT